MDGRRSEFLPFGLLNTCQWRRRVRLCDVGTLQCPIVLTAIKPAETLAMTSHSLFSAARLPISNLLKASHRAFEPLSILSDNASSISASHKPAESPLSKLLDF